ncbi:MAG: DUF2147 domain-containing protein [Bacteroidaceae bacterium]|nr:DUF2147 domain-containing protein [Bacteroidaceae bacterium]
MKRFYSFIILSLFATLSVMAQADKLIGNYWVDHNGKQSKVKFFKYQDGYRAQIYWVSDSKNPDGSTKLDVKNPDKSLRNIPTSQIVLIDKLIYDKEDDIWKDSKIYDPTRGMKFNVDVRFKDENTLELRGKVGPFFKRIYWKRIK